MSSPDSKIKIIQVLNRNEFNWGIVHDALISRFKLPETVATGIVRRFYRSIAAPLNPRWIGTRNLTVDENDICSVLCETHSADIVVIKSSCDLLRWPLTIKVEQELKIAPQLSQKSNARGVTVGTATLQIAKGIFKIKSRLTPVALYGAAFVASTLLFSGILAAFLYGLATFILFTQLPFLVTRTATSEWLIGATFLGFTVLMAGATGTAIRNSLRAWRSGGR